MPFPRKIDEGRVMRGQQISNLEGQVQRLDDITYQVKSQAGHGLYTVVFLKGYRAWRCSCPDHIYREVKCKHIWAVEFSLRLREKVKENVLLEPVSRKTDYATTSTETFRFSPVNHVEDISL